ncbi:uncharacterized protein JCM6883_006330 [Sporobolomyces salmoneus]|uniref:uncharacterized protein n=1 Tax=Sporobolomyces salmoneus TaxID=183962 RepID=UPI00317391AC
MSGQVGGGRVKYDREAKNRSTIEERGAEEGGAVQQEFTRNTKRTKVSASRAVGTAGTGSGDNAAHRVPVDIWLLIAEQTDACTLLQLARTSNYLRQIFFNKDLSRSTWKKSTKNLPKFPKLETEEIYGPALIEFLLDDYCSFCGKGGASEANYIWKLRYHSEYCFNINKTVMSSSSIRQKLPAIRDEALDCVPCILRPQVAYNVPQRRDLAYFVVEQTRQVNFELLEFIKLSNDMNDEEVAVQAFRALRRPQVLALERDSLKIYHWQQNLVRHEYNRMNNTLFRHHSKNGHLSVPRLTDFVPSKSLSAWIFRLFTNGQWEEDYYRFEKAFIANYHHAHPKSLGKERIRRRASLHSEYTLLKRQDATYPPFSIYTELPSVRSYWETAQSHDRISATEANIKKAQRWIKLSFARILSQSLDQIGRPLPPDLKSSLHPRNYLLPPAFFGGVDDASNPTGLYMDDPAKISEEELAQLLDRFSNQAWFFESQRPQSFGSVQKNNHERISSIKYKGPLFPLFSTFWHQVLLQILEKSGVGDGPYKATRQVLQDLGECCSCKECSAGGDEEKKMKLSDFTAHLKDHDFPSDTIPDKSLVVFHAQAVESNEVKTEQ